MKRLMTLVAVVTVLADATAHAAPAPDASCWWTPNPATVAAPVTFTATGLPTNDTFAVTYDPYPVGTTRTTDDGTYTFTTAFGAGTVTAYVWQRGGGPSLLKPGPGLNDYRVIAICSVEVL